MPPLDECPAYSLEYQITLWERYFFLTSKILQTKLYLLSSITVLIELKMLKQKVKLSPMPLYVYKFTFLTFGKYSHSSFVLYLFIKYFSFSTQPANLLLTTKDTVSVLPNTRKLLSTWIPVRGDMSKEFKFQMDASSKQTRLLLMWNIFSLIH